jgi:molecular chaperone DnaJ
MAAQREWFEKDYYQSARRGRDRDAPKEITKAYRKLARDSHPDTHPGDAAAEERFKEVSAAYDVLGDETKRKEYDEVRRLGPVGGFGPGGRRRPRWHHVQRGRRRSRRPARPDVRTRSARRWRVGRRRPAARRRRRGHAHARLRRRGARAHDHPVPHDRRPVRHLQRVGRQARHVSRRCARAAAGAGSSTTTRASSRSRRRASACAGRGVTIESPCPTCRGAGVEKRQREVQARIPAGVADGQKIRLKGRGAPGRNGGPAGDLIVECHVVPHARFGRDGDNLTVRVPVTFDRGRTRW